MYVKSQTQAISGDGGLNFCLRTFTQFSSEVAVCLTLNGLIVLISGSCIDFIRRYTLFADIYVIFTIKTSLHFIYAESLAGFSVNLKNTGSYVLVFKFSFGFFVIYKLVICTSVHL